jgi:hypothetical protein
MTAALALLLAAAPFDWPQVVERFPDLKSFAPAAPLDAPLFARIGGKCVRAAQKMPLGEGARNGHVWHWSYEVSPHRDAVTLAGPKLVHGFDTAKDTRTFKSNGTTRKPFFGPPKDDVVPLYEASFTLDIECWGIDESQTTCGDKRITCKRCSILRLVGEPRGAQYTYGDGVVRADLTSGCEKRCEGPGLPWSEFVSLKMSAAATRVVDLQAKPVAELYLTEAACASGTSDLAPDFTAEEPR